ncbi:MAG: methyltransferase domain-containing protein [Acidobacteriota bacterium]
MNDRELQNQIAAAEAYEALHLPALFHQWASRVADAAEIQPAQRVLDIACGTGVLAREALDRVGSTGTVVGVDPNAGMLAVAQRLGPGIEWRAGSAEELPCGDRSFDAVVSQFGLMFFVDRARAITEMLRALKPEGRLAVAVWSSLEESPAYSTAVNLLEDLAGRPAADALRAPFVLGDKEQLASLFDHADLASVEITTRSGTARFPSIRTMVEADLRGWLPVMGVNLAEDLILHILEEAEAALAAYVTESGEPVFEMPAHIVTGRLG